MMKNLMLLGTAALALTLCGCSTPSANPGAANASGRTEAQSSKGTAMKGVGADQIQVTADGAKADQMTGTALKGDK